MLETALLASGVHDKETTPSVVSSKIGGIISKQTFRVDVYNKMKEKIMKAKIAGKKLALVSLGVVIGVSYFFAYTQYIETIDCLK